MQSLRYTDWIAITIRTHKTKEAQYLWVQIAQPIIGYIYTGFFGQVIYIYI